jgi:heme/copper-type cytochrome/quinol oxidase subunit 4
LKKTLFYLIVAAILGILITVVPLVTVAETRIGSAPQHAPSVPSLNQGLKQLDGGGSTTSQLNRSYLTVLIISLIIALLAYTLIGRRAPRRYDLVLRFPPH